MSGYSELIKNFENIRRIMREFYLYGFKSRAYYDSKSLRSYDNDRRRLESWLGDYMSFTRTEEGKNVFISIDSRTISQNPFYKAFKAKSFTDGDITLHFILFDILNSPETPLSLEQIIQKIDSYLDGFENPIVFDPSTIRKKLKEYISYGLIHSQKSGKKLLYRRAEDIQITADVNTLHFFSESAPCGVIGSFLLDKQSLSPSIFNFRHHYITSAIDSDITYLLFCAIREKRAVTLSNLSRRKNNPKKMRVIPLKIFISVQNGREHLLAFHPESGVIRALRTDYISNVRIEDEDYLYDEYYKKLETMLPFIWGVSFKDFAFESKRTEHVEFSIKTEYGDDFTAERLMREKRVGYVEKTGENSYRFTANVYDTLEMLPWIRTFTGHITSIYFSNKEVQSRFESDLEKMYEMYQGEETI